MCADTCPASRPFKYIIGNETYGFNSTIECLTKCSKRGDKFTDFEEMEDGQLICRESCPEGYVYEITDLGNRCLKECKDG